MNEGPAKKRNVGIRMAKSEYVAFFDDDVHIYPKCIENMHEALLAEPTAGMAYGKLHNFEHKNRFDEAGSFITSTGFLWSRAGQNIVDEGQYDKPEYILAGKSASCMVRKSIFYEVGGFDEDFFILGEETDLSWRMWLMGFKVLWVPSSYCEHKFNTKYKPVRKHYNTTRVQFMGCRNYLTMLYKNLGKEHLWIIPIHLTIWFFAALAMVGTFKVGQGVKILQGIWAFLKNWKVNTQKRKTIQAKRMTDEDILWPIISRRTPRGYYTQRFAKYIRIGLHG
jgi:GT2 family glycosyltransferase